VLFLRVVRRRIGIIQRAVAQQCEVGAARPTTPRQTSAEILVEGDDPDSSMRTKCEHRAIASDDRLCVGRDRALQIRLSGASERTASGSVRTARF
jgi:hypothetical protein